MARFQLIRLIQADFQRLLNEPIEEGEGNILGQLAEAMPQSVTVTLEEREAIERTNEDTVKLSKRGRISYITDEISRLPTDILLNIICRLSLKSVIICTSVHPDWYRVIKSPEFAKALLKHHVDSLAVSQIDVVGTRHQIFDIDESLGLPDNLQPTFNFETVGRMPIRGSVGGFLLFSGAAQFIVGNPLTGERVQIDFPPNILVMEHEIVTFGFGKGNDHLYKVIIISQDYLDDQQILATRCQVYTIGVGGGEWREAQLGDDALYSHAERVVYLNGCHHWLARSEASGVYLISIFEIASETFTRWTAPVQHEHADMTLSVLNGKLCLCDSTDANHTSIWLMQSYGEDESWDQVYVFSTDVRMQP